MSFQPAVRVNANLRLGFTGPSGAGKTYSALEIAVGISKALNLTIGLADTENGSASLYGDRFKFSVLEIKPPYTVQKFIDAIDQAIDAGIGVLIIDSISHEWAGEGGMLERVDQIASTSKSGNSYMAWAQGTKEHEKFKSALLNAPMHLICTMRSKQDYVLEESGNGKKAPKKVGMAPIQREGMEYEFTTVFDLSLGHDASVSKDRTGLFDGKIFKPTEKIGKQLAEWLTSGKSPSPPTPTPSREAVATGQGATETRVKPMPPADPEEGEKGITREDWGSVTDAMYNAENLNELAATYKAAVRKHENEGTEAQMKALASYKDQLKIHAEGK